MPTPLILASASPRRRELLSLLGLPFSVQVADVDEQPLPGELPVDMVVRLSVAKAQAIAARLQAGWVIASDTIVVLKGELLGKPANAEEAEAMLRRLQGRPHTVISGIVLWDAAGGSHLADLAQTTVHMRPYSDQEMADYIASGDPLDKAGAYGIQNRGFCPVERVEGCYASVMGFPLCHLYRMLAAWGAPLAQTPVAACRSFTGHECQAYPEILGRSCAARADRAAARTVRDD